ncbi:hypothetical protein [Microbacterium elymi]|uniref:Uncharacterized protein n=1 Tax=Microbacterium elymi TaxID=2909587 RepID=A0ABY5NKW2_9MICO|nr:hypothetical protein [Microbacterium elymi]UUT35809.1 hypothetical protein L2X98_21735 [Microbacterium elymi]
MDRDAPHRRPPRRPGVPAHRGGRRDRVVAGRCPERAWASFRERVGMLGPLWTAAGIGFFASPEIEWSASR